MFGMAVVIPAVNVKDDKWGDNKEYLKECFSQGCKSPQPPHHCGGVIFFTTTFQMVGWGDFSPQPPFKWWGGVIFFHHHFLNGGVG
jgi:hypothetical protein